MCICGLWVGIEHLWKIHAESFEQEIPEELPAQSTRAVENSWMGWNIMNVISSGCVELVVSGRCYQMTFWVDFETSHTLVLGQPAMAVIEVDEHQNRTSIDTKNNTNPQ